MASKHTKLITIILFTLAGAALSITPLIAPWVVTLATMGIPMLLASIIVAVILGGVGCLVAMALNHWIHAKNAPSPTAIQQPQPADALENTSNHEKEQQMRSTVRANTLSDTGDHIPQKHASSTVIANASSEDRQAFEQACSQYPAFDPDSLRKDHVQSIGTGVPIETKEQWINALEEGNLTVIKELSLKYPQLVYASVSLEYDIDPTTRDKLYFHAATQTIRLHSRATTQASRQGHLEVFKYLADIDPRAMDASEHYASTPLHQAIENLNYVAGFVAHRPPPRDATPEEQQWYPDKKREQAECAEIVVRLCTDHPEGLSAKVDGKTPYDKWHAEEDYYILDDDFEEMAEKLRPIEERNTTCKEQHEKACKEGGIDIISNRDEGLEERMAQQWLKAIKCGDLKTVKELSVKHPQLVYQRILSKYGKKDQHIHAATKAIQCRHLDIARYLIYLDPQAMKPSSHYTLTPLQGASEIVSDCERHIEHYRGLAGTNPNDRDRIDKQQRQMNKRKHYTKMVQYFKKHHRATSSSEEDFDGSTMDASSIKSR